MKKALITGITGQDGSYLAEMLLSKGYQVTGMVRRASTETFDRIAHFKDRIVLRQADMLDQFSLVKLLDEVQPDEIYNLAAMSFVPPRGASRCSRANSPPWASPRSRSHAHGLPQGPFLPGLVFRDVRQGPRTPQTEKTPFYPRSPLRGRQGLRPFHHGQLPRILQPLRLLGILFNHETPRRGKEFVTRKITTRRPHQVGTQKELRMGNLDAKRDWGFAGDYVRALWMMLQQDKADELRRRHRENPFRPSSWNRLRARRPQLRGLRRHRSGFHPPRGSGTPARQSRQGQGPARLEAGRQLRAAVTMMVDADLDRQMGKTVTA
jgi:GDPmannose 4,6-dehydratase